MGFANFYRRFIKGFSKIAALLISMLKTTAPTLPARLVRPKVHKNELDTDGGGGIGGGRIDNRLANLSCSTKKMGSRLDFLTSEASLAFTRLRKVFIEALILHHFDPERHIQIETNASGYAIGGVLSQLTTEKGLMDQITHKTNGLNPPSKIG